MTNEEAHESFKENCREAVRALMEEHSGKMLEKVSDSNTDTNKNTD